MSLEFILATPAEIARELGARLKAARLGQGLQQGELAQMAGVSRNTITSLENRGSANLESFLRLAAALGLTHEMQQLFAAEAVSIAQLEAASKPARRRAPRKPRRGDEVSLASPPGQSLGLPSD